MSKFYNVVSRKTVPNNPEKQIYHKVGVLKVTESGGWFLQMYHQPNTDYLVFPNHNESLPVIDFGNHEA